MNPLSSYVQRTEFKTYLPFCKNKPTSDGVRVEHEKYFTSRQNELGQKLNIEDLLIAPVQRLPKYQLLIKVGRGRGYLTEWRIGGGGGDEKGQQEKLGFRGLIYRGTV